MKKITLSDVAKHANVSNSTVSQYLNKRYGYMSPKTKETIKQAIEELGYQPNVVARSLKQKSTSTIGIIVANILHSFSTQVIRSIEDYCRERDFHAIVCNADDDPDTEKKYIEMLRAKQVDGLIVFPTGGNVELFEEMVREDDPVVFVDRYVSGLPIDSVLLDNRKASELAVDRFVENGCERIAIVTTPLIRDVVPRRERVEGFRNTLRKHDLALPEAYQVSLEVDQMRPALQELFSGDDPPDAILAGNDLALMEILNFVKEQPIRIPDDVALIGIDDVSFAHIYIPSLTAVAQPAFAMGEKAAALLLDKIKSGVEQRYQFYRFEPELKIRESCRFGEKRREHDE